MAKRKIQITTTEEERANTIPWPILEGDDVVLLAEYNPDQLARYIDKVYSSYYGIDQFGVYDDPIYEGNPNNHILTKEEFIVWAKQQGVNPEVLDLDELTRLEAETNRELPFKSGVPEVAKLLGLLETEEDHKEFRRVMSAYITHHMPAKLWEFYSLLVVEAIDHSLRRLARDRRIKEWEEYKKPNKKDTEYFSKVMLRSLKKRLNVKRGRAKGTTIVFQNLASFEKALRETIQTLPPNASPGQGWEEIKKHALCKDKTASLSAFRYWLGKLGLNWTGALKKYGKSNKHYMKNK